jgi:hypothetical protein
MASRASGVIHQAWIQPIADDPEAVSAFAVARDRLAAGRTLTELNRFRVIEIGPTRLPAERVAHLLHESTQFYNPHKERCTLRSHASEAGPAGAEGEVVLVVDRDGERRPAAERWWRHETGETVAVREGVAWAMVFDPAADARAHAEELAVLRDARHGLLCNPWSQEAKPASSPIPLPWIRDAGAAKGNGR